MKGSACTVLFRNALSTSPTWLPWVKLLWHINDFSAVVISCRCRRSSSSPLKHHILSRSNVSSYKPISCKLTLFEASAVNEILQISPNLQEVSKAEGIRPNHNSKLSHFQNNVYEKITHFWSAGNECIPMQHECKLLTAPSFIIWVRTE